MPHLWCQIVLEIVLEVGEPDDQFPGQPESSCSISNTPCTML